MIRIKDCLACILAIGLFAGCGTTTPLNQRYIHTPAGVAPAFLKHKGDMQISPAIFAAPETLFASNDKTVPNDKFWGLGAQGAYAITKNIFVQAGGWWQKETDYYSDNDITLKHTRSHINYRRSHLNLGVGYFSPVSESGKVYFNAVGGLDFGIMKTKVIDEQSADNYFFNANNHRFYLTPSLQFLPSPQFSMAFSLRASLLKYSGIVTDYTAENLAHVQLNQLREKSFTFIDPSLNFQFGFNRNNWLKLDLGVTGATNPDLYSNATMYEEKRNLYSRSVIGTVGVSIFPFRKVAE